MLHLTPFLLFEGNCAEAMEFYATCFGGELTLTRLADTPMKEGFPVEQHQKITYAYLKSDTVELSATDWLHPKRLPQPGNTVALFVSSASHEELRNVFDRLSEGADLEFFAALKEMPFGLYGSLTDRFGVDWIFRGDRVTA